MIGLIIGGILLAFVSGAGLYLYSSGKTAGRAACVAELKAADDQLVAAAAKVEQETANKIIDMAAAYEAGEANAKTRTVYVTKQGAADVAKYPIFTNPICVLPPESLRNLNAARAGLRSEPPADGVRGAVDGAGAGARIAPGPAAPAGTVREPSPVADRVVPGTLPSDAAGRRPLGKMREKP